MQPKHGSWLAGALSAVVLSVVVNALLFGGGRTLFAQADAPQGLAESQAAMGTAFTFQGRLHNGDEPADGTFEMRFTLFNAAEAGSQVGDVLTVNEVAVVDSAFAVQLDFGISAFTGDARFLQVEVRPAESEE